MNNWDDDVRFRNLKEKAAQKIKDSGLNSGDFPMQEIQDLVENLQTQRIELEIQNEELKKTQSDLERSQQKYFELYEAAPVGFIIIRENGIVADANLTAVNKLGVNRQRMTNRPFHLYVYVDDLAHFQRHIKQVFDTQRSAQCEVRLKTADQKYIFARLDSRPMDASNNADMCLTSFVDITSQKKLEQALRVSEEKFRRVIETTPIGICITDEKGTFEYVNPSYCAIYGWNPHELIGHEFTKVVKPEEALMWKKRHDSFLDTGGEVAGRWTVLHKNGDEIIIKVEAAQYKGDDQKTRKATFVVDITKEVELENKIIEARDTAQKASKAKSEFLANMSHEIRTPMNGIVGMVELLRGSNPTDEQKQYLEMISSSTQTLMGVINDILDLSKIESGRMELEQAEFNLHNCLRDALRSLSSGANKKGLELGLYIHEAVPQGVIGDSIRLSQIVYNLVGNAIKFTESGYILINVELVRKSSRTICLQFSVKDTGIGIEEDKIARIMQPFTQLDSSTTRQFGGTGLGLAIARQLVTAMDGQLNVKSVQGEGSIFSFQANFSSGQNDDKNLQKAVTSDDFSRGIDRAFIFNHGNIVSGIVEKYLEELKINAQMISNEEEIQNAVHDCIGRKQRCLVVFNFDKNPRANLELFSKIRTQCDNSQVLFLSICQNILPGDISHFKNRGLHNVLINPFTRDDLLNALETSVSSDLNETGFSQKKKQVQPVVKNLNILVGEDNSVNQVLAKKLLAKRGHKVEIASNGDEVFQKYLNGSYDLIFMDVQMPVMDGLETTRKIRAFEKKQAEAVNGSQTGIESLGDDNDHLLPHIPIIAMTAFATSDDRKKCFSAGMDDYISKPIDISKLNDKLQIYECGSKQQDISEVEEFLDGALVALNGDMDLLDELTQVFVEERSSYMNDIRTALDNSDRELLQRSAHRVRGALSVFKKQDMINLAEILENISNYEDFDTIRCRVDEFEKSLGNFVSLITKKVNV